MSSGQCCEDSRRALETLGLRKRRLDLRLELSLDSKSHMPDLLPQSSQIDSW